MANSNTPFGLGVYRGGGSYKYNEQATTYRIPSTDNSAYYVGDTVKAAASSDAIGTTNVIKITNGTDAIRGAIVGIHPIYHSVSIQGLPLSLEYVSIPATKAGDYYVMVVEDPSTIWMIQDDGITTGNLVAASANLNFNMTITAGSTVQNLSASVILSSSFATTNTFSMKAMGLAPFPNNAYGAYAKWLARINVSELTGSFAGV